MRGARAGTTHCRGVAAGRGQVGLFVNAPEREICRTFDDLGLDLVQLHGDEPAEFLARLGDRPLMRAFRVGQQGLKPVGEYLEKCRRLHSLPRLTLLDAFVKGAYGGTGRVADWGLVARYPIDDWHPPLVLAGGLGPENVGEAIRAVRPAAVDTASAVESSPGHKDLALVERFVAAAQEAFRSIF